MPHYGDGRASGASIRSAKRNALMTADEVGCESLAIPALDCGAAGFPLEAGARFIRAEIAAHDPISLNDVRFIANSDERRIASELGGNEE